jgi:hypothetical protein
MNRPGRFRLYSVGLGGGPASTVEAALVPYHLWGHQGSWTDAALDSHLLDCICPSGSGVTSRVAESLESAGAASIVPQSPLDDVLQIAKRLAAVWHFVARSAGVLVGTASADPTPPRRMRCGSWCTQFASRLSDRRTKGGRRTRLTAARAVDERHRIEKLVIRRSPVNTRYTSRLPRTPRRGAVAVT